MIQLLFTFLLVFGLALPADALEITFTGDASVDGTIVKLGDVAHFDEDTDMSRALATKTVGQAPPPGEKISFRSLNIKHYLVSNQAIPQDTRWTGSPTVTVHRRGVKIGADEIQSFIAEFLRANKQNLPDAKINFMPDSLPLPFILPRGALSHDVIPSNPAILCSSRFSIIFRVDNKVVKNMSVKGKVEALAEVVVAAKPLKKGHVVDAQMLSTAILDISKMTAPGQGPEDIIGKKLKRSLRAGSPVLASMVESLPVVRRGERVKIVISSGHLYLTATGLAHSDGQLDQMIRVQNINSNKIIYCRVTAPGLVEVML
jgi:flagella basal body P-ring formation protein FlgA